MDDSQSRKRNSPQAPHKVRLDRWLWAARFYKTRAQAKKAINSGRILVDGVRPKPAKEIGRGVMLSVRKNMQTWHIAVVDLSEKRGPATEARLLYAETQESVDRREINSLQQKSWRQSKAERPTTRERRQIQQFNQQALDRLDLSDN